MAASVASQTGSIEPRMRRGSYAIAMSVVVLLLAIQLGAFARLPGPSPDNLLYGVLRGFWSLENVFPVVMCAFFSFRLFNWSHASAYDAPSRLWRTVKVRWRRSASVRVGVSIAAGSSLLLILTGWPFSLWLVLFAFVAAVTPFLLRRHERAIWLLPLLWLPVGLLLGQTHQWSPGHVVSCEGGGVLAGVGGEFIPCDDVVFLLGHDLLLIGHEGRSRLVATSEINPASAERAIGPRFFRAIPLALDRLD